MNLATVKLNSSLLTSDYSQDSEVLVISPGECSQTEMAVLQRLKHGKKLIYQ